jgi:hypothetical protein
MKIGISKSKITPPEGIELSGFGFYLERKAIGIHDDLFTRALLINNDSGDSVLIISNDIIGLDFTSVEEIKKILALNYNINPQNIYVCCTHTHSGPSTMSLRGCGEINIKYLNFLKDIIIKNATKAKDHLVDVDCKIISSEIIDFCYNREKNIPVARPISILKFNKTHSCTSDLVLLINFSCHPVILRKDNLKFSRDFIGPFIDNLEDESKIKMAIFTNCCCGDIDPLVVRTSKDFLKYEDVKYWGKVLAKEVKEIFPRN